MNQKDAAKILQINGDINPEIVKTAFRKLAMLYHPDRNPAGLELMKLLNVAFDTLKAITRNIDVTENANSYKNGASNYGEALNKAINAIINLGLNIEICGSWVWVSGNTKPHKEALKAAGFNWNSKKVKWSFRPAGYKSANRGRWSMDKIRDTYGSRKVQNATFKQVEA